MSVDLLVIVVVTIGTAHLLAHVAIPLIAQELDLIAGLAIVAKVSFAIGKSLEIGVEIAFADLSIFFAFAVIDRIKHPKYRALGIAVIGQESVSNVLALLLG